MRSSERWIAGALFTVALLAFFFPIASLQLPVVGNIEASGYDFLSKSKQFEARLGKLNNQAPERSTEALSSSDVPSTSPKPLPVSMETITLLPFEILGSFGLSAISFLLCVIGASRGAAKVSSTIAGALGIGAVLHIVIADSDLHTWFQAQMQAGANEMRDNPFAALAQNIGTLIANTVHFRPGPGLYALAASASIGALLLHSGLVSGSSVDRETEQVEGQLHSDSGSRLFAFTVLAALAIGAAVFVLQHHSPSQVPATPTKSVRTTPAITAPKSDPATVRSGTESGDPGMKSRLVAALNELSAKQGHNHLYSMCSDNTLCIMDAEASNDGFMENFTTNTSLAQQLYGAGFRGLIIANGSHAWGWDITDAGYSAIPDVKPPQESSPEQ